MKKRTWISLALIALLLMALLILLAETPALTPFIYAIF